MYYVYVLMDSSKEGIFEYDSYTFLYEPFYVGKGINNRIKDTFYDKSPFKYNKIKKLKYNGIKIEVLKINENLTNEESLILEKQLISIIGRRDLNKGPLVNQTDGGDGRSNSKHSEETKLKISKTKKSQNLSSKHTEETKIHLREINMGENNPFHNKNHSDIVKQNHSNLVTGSNHPMFGKQHSEETKQKIKNNRRLSVDQNAKNLESTFLNRKSVLQFDLNNNLIAEFESVKIAAGILNISASHLSKLCRGERLSKLFIFKYKEESSYTLSNSYVVKIGDYFKFDDQLFKLVKRNIKSVTCEDSKNTILTLRRNDCLFLYEKRQII